jgi:hypothetical protein
LPPAPGGIVTGGISGGGGTTLYGLTNIARNVNRCILVQHLLIQTATHYVASNINEQCHHQ